MLSNPGPKTSQIKTYETKTLTSVNVQDSSFHSYKEDASTSL